MPVLYQSSIACIHNRMKGYRHLQHPPLILWHLERLSKLWPLGDRPSCHHPIYSGARYQVVKPAKYWTHCSEYAAIPRSNWDRSDHLRQRLSNDHVQHVLFNFWWWMKRDGTKVWNVVDGDICWTIHHLWQLQCWPHLGSLFLSSQTTLWLDLLLLAPVTCICLLAFWQSRDQLGLHSPDSRVLVSLYS